MRMEVLADDIWKNCDNGVKEKVLLLIVHRRVLKSQTGKTIVC